MKFLHPHLFAISVIRALCLTYFCSIYCFSISLHFGRTWTVSSLSCPSQFYAIPSLFVQWILRIELLFVYRYFPIVLFLAGMLHLILFPVLLGVLRFIWSFVSIAFFCFISFKLHSVKYFSIVVFIPFCFYSYTPYGALDSYAEGSRIDPCGRWS